MSGDNVVSLGKVKSQKKLKENIQSLSAVFDASYKNVEEFIIALDECEGKHLIDDIVIAFYTDIPDLKDASDGDTKNRRAYCVYKILSSKDTGWVVDGYRLVSLQYTVIMLDTLLMQYNLSLKEQITTTYANDEDEKED